MANNTDTIVAVATPPGRGGIGIVRISGPRAAAIAEALLGGVPAPRRAAHRTFCAADGTAIDTGVALYFSAPHSYTGEDTLELQGHGSPAVMDMLLSRVIALGARPARPGEFTERAFLNDKLDLAQAEAVADLIDSGSEQAARAALRSLRGEFSARVHALVEALIELRTRVEAALDFPDEEIDAPVDEALGTCLRDILAAIAALQTGARQGALLRDGLHVVIAGRPNVGKSSLLNRLAGHAAAIVTDVPGTTRDVLREQIQLDGLPLHVIDTAGLRDSADRVEQQGVNRAWDEIARADRILLVIDDHAGLGEAERTILARLPPDRPVTVVRNKIDVSGRTPGIASGEDGTQVAVSALTGTGLDLLIAHLKTCAGYQVAGEGTFMARQRHLEALDRARAHLENGQRALRERRAAELLAEDLRRAQTALAEITGEFTSEDLLERIFSSFCIGK
ncbi:MAG: tRNA uridine-5-carboxymethylaminomethyl(34) synthesis GTPase MnmE [Gammaproteobacteria bacterium]|nr:tRNA uridine-5-carboxymethylaminomethyl(34) synthesis GTPase MnmE [Gammaproteobacteria bacterium]